MNTIPPASSPSEYYLAIQAEDQRLDDVLASIRADAESGALTCREALDNRVAALEAHLRKCRELRRHYFGSDD